MKVKIKNLELEAELIYKPKNKNLYFKYKDDKLYITVNKKRYLKTINKIIEEYENTLYKYIMRMLPNKEEKKHIHFFGKVYNCIIKEDIQNDIIINENNFIIYSNKRNKENIVYSYFKKKLEDYINSILETAIIDFSDINIRPIIYYKKITSYYGKCIPEKNIIYLNINLAKYDKIYIKNVLYHEMCHFKYLNHQKEFYDYFNTKMKNAKKIQIEMKKIRYNDLF